MPQQLIDDCFAHDRERLTHSQAIELLKSSVDPVAAAESVPLDDALGRILAEPIRATEPVPAHTNAAVDGYAFAARDYDRATGATLPISGRVAAGRPMAEGALAAGAVRIFTGAALPAGLDTVAMQEDCRELSEQNKAMVRLPSGLKAGANVRRAGEDVRAGEVLFEPGHIIRPQDLAALASVGHAFVPCFRPLRVGLVATGDEVAAPGSGPLRYGSVYDANTAMLTTLARLAGAQAEGLGIWPDRAEEVERRLAAQAPRFDVLVTTGGASRGEEDHIAAALQHLGTRHFWQIAVKPGRPMMLGQIGSTIVIGLPGNPVAVFVCFLMYAWPMLRRLGGAPWPEPQRLIARARFAFPKRKLGRREFWRGTLTDEAGELGVIKYARDGSGLISSLRAADCLIDVAEDVPEVREGDPLSVIPFSAFGIASR
jgi:molybdopterin molybdotransferase